MLKRFCDDHQWVGSQSETCPECDALWDSMSKGRSPMDTKSPTGRLTQSQPQLQELPKMNINTVSKTVSIKVQPTRLTGGGVIDVPLCSTTQKATHWSLYLRKEDESLVWVEDIPASSNSEEAISLLYGRAMVRAAKLSMEHKAYIEDIQ